jgi:hypothetical protein
LIPRDHVNAARHSLKKHDAEAFARARHHEYVREPEVVGDLFRRDGTDELDMLCYALLYG